MSRVAASSTERRTSTSQTAITKKDAVVAAPSPAAQAFDRLMQRVETQFGSLSSSASASATANPAAEAARKMKEKLAGKSDENASDVLFELDRTLSTIDRSIVSRHQSTLEKLFLQQILPKCENYVLRGVSSSCLVKLLEHSSHNVSNWYHDLLKCLESREQNVRIVGLQCFAALSKRFGSQFLLSIPEVLSILTKLAKNRDELVIKELILDVIAGYYEGTGGGSRAAGSNESTHLDMEKVLSRFMTDRSPGSLRKKVGEVCMAIIYYSIDCRELDPLLSLLLKSLQAETEPDVRFALAESMGEMLSFAVRKDWRRIGAEAAATAKRNHARPARKQQGELRNLDEVLGWVERLLATTNQKSSATTALAPANLALRTAYMQIALRFCRNLCIGNAHHLSNGSIRLALSGTLGGEDPSWNAEMGAAIDESNVVTQVLCMLSWLDRSKFTHGSMSGAGNILMGGASAAAAMTLPPTAAAVAGVVDHPADCNVRQMAHCISYALLQGILPFQTERGLEAVGKALVTFLNQIIKSGGNSSGSTSVSASMPNDILSNYQALICFQLLSFIFARLGLAIESLVEFKDSCLEVLLLFLSHPQYALRTAASQSFRSFARAASPQIATWLSVLYKIVVMQLVEITDSQDNARSPRSADAAIDPTVYFSLHGHVSALAAMVGVIPEAPCGVPAVIIESVYDVCKRLLALAVGAESTATPSSTVHFHSLIEGGWLLLSSLISLGTEWVAPRLNSLFLLWRGCLGKKPASGKQKQEDINLEIKMRIKAFIALRSFTQVMRSRMQMIQTSSGWAPSPILKATVIFLRNTFALLKALQSEKSLDPSVIVSMAQLKSVLMDVFAAVPPISYASNYVALLHMVVSEFTSKNPPLNTELARILARADANLNAPYLTAVASNGGVENDYVRFLDLSDPIDTAPIINPSTGQPIPSPTSFYDAQFGGGNVLADYSWNWCLRAQVQTETRKELSAIFSPATPTHATPLSPTPPKGAEDTDDGLSDKGLEGLSNADALEDSSSSTPASFSENGESTSGGAAGDDSSFASRALWSSLRNHADRLSVLPFGGAHSVECFESPAVRSANSCLRLFATLYADQSPTHKEQLIKHFHAIVQKAKTMNSLHSNIITNVATAMLAIARDVAERDSGGVKCAPAMELMISIANDLMLAPNPMVRRAVGEMLGLLVRVESDDTIVSKLFSSLQNQLHAKDQLAVTTSVFALGCVHRYGGAMKTLRFLPFTVAALQSLARDFTEPFRLWILHALWLAVDTGGLSFAAYVQPTLSILQAHAMHDIDARTPAVSQAIGRIIHAVMGALGPEVAAAGAVSSMGSSSSGIGVDKFLNLWSHLQQETNNVYSQLEVINILHQLVLWSDPMQYPSILPVLVRALSSEEEEVRRAAVKCLLQFGEKDSTVILRKSFDRRLVAMLDTELHPSMLALVKHTLTTWISSYATQAAGVGSPGLAPGVLSPLAVQHLAPRPPTIEPTSGEDSIRYRLFDVCKRVVVGGHKLPSDSQTAKADIEPAAKSKRVATSSTAMSDTKDEDDDDDAGILGEDEEGGPTPASRARARRNSTTSEHDRLFAVTDTRWQSKTFALDCLSSLLRTIHRSCPPSEFDLAYARANAKFPLQFVVQQLPDLLTVACLATSSVFDMLRIKGTHCMKILVELFAEVKDPDAVHFEEDDPDAAGGNELLLHLYSAQVTSALSQSMAQKSESGSGESRSGSGSAAAPQLRSKACELAVVYLRSGVTSDRMVVSRLCKLLLQPILAPADTLTNLNNQFDGNMSTLLLLAHLHALALLHAAVLDAPPPSSSRKKSSKALTPKQRALQALRDVLAPHFPLLTLHYFQALKDFLLVSTLSRKEISKLKGFYFDGANTNNPLPVYLNYWDALLAALCANLRREDGEAFSMLIASDGSTGGERARRELVQVCLGVIANSLHLMLQHELRGAGERGRSGSMAGMADASAAMMRSYNDKRHRHANLDAVTLARVDRENEQSCVATCVTSLAGVLQPSQLRADIVSPAMLLELLPLIGWNLAYRPTASEPQVLTKRQEGCIQLLEQLITVSLREVVEDEKKLTAFLNNNHTTVAPSLDGDSTHGPSSIPDIIHAIGEIFVSTLHSFLPTYGAASPQAYQHNLNKLADASVYLTADVTNTLHQLLALLPSFIDLAALAETATTKISAEDTPSAQHSQGLRIHYLTLALNLAQHVMRKASTELCQAALTTVHRLLFHTTFSDGSNSKWSRPIVPPFLIQQLLQQLHNVLLNPLPLNTDFRVEALFGCLWQLLLAPLADNEPDERIAEQVRIFVNIWNQFGEHASSRFRLLSMQALHTHILVVPDLAMSPPTLLLTQRALVTLLQHAAPMLMLAIHQPPSAEESAAAVQCLLNVFHSLHASHPSAESVKERLLPMLLPLVVDHLASVPGSITSVFALATQQPALFKANVALLPLDYRTRLQTAVMSMSAAAQQAAMAQAAAVTAPQHSPSPPPKSRADEASKVSKKSSKSKRGESGVSSSAPSAAPSIELSMDFSKFNKRK